MSFIQLLSKDILFVRIIFFCFDLLELGLKIDAMKKIYIQVALLDLESSSFQDTLDRITGLRLKESRQHGL